MEVPEDEPLSSEERRFRACLAPSAQVSLGFIGTAVVDGWYGTGIVRCAYAFR